MANIVELTDFSAPRLDAYVRLTGPLVWKHPAEDFNMGSQLIVHESQVAIFFRNG